MSRAGLPTPNATSARFEFATARHLLEQAGEPMVGLDLDGCVVLWNREATRLLGREQGEVLGQPLVDLMPDDDAFVRTDHMRRECLAGRNAPPVAAQWPHRDGSLVELEISTGPMHDDHGHAVGTLQILRRARVVEPPPRAGEADRDLLLAALDQLAIVSVADRRGRITAVNDRFCALSQYTRDELVGQNHRVVNSGTHDAAFWRGMWSTIAGGRAWRGEICNRAKDGTPYWVHSIIVPFRDERGHIDRYVSVRFDITPLKRGEQALRRSEAMLARTGQMARVGGWELDIASGALLWSDETCRIHGVGPGHRPTLEEAIGYYAPEAQPVIQALVERGIAQRENWDVELPLMRADGAPVRVRALGEVEFDGERPIRLVGAFQDVTAQHEAHEALRRQQTLTESMLASAPVAVRVARLRDNRVRVVNDRFCRLVRRTRDECMELDVAPLYADPQAFADITRQLKAGLPVHDRLVELRLPDRPELAPVWAMASYMLIDHEGEPAVLAWLYDVTELEQARESARRSRELMLQALDATQTALAIYGVDDRLEMCNRRFLQMYEKVAPMLVPGTPFRDVVRAITQHYRPDGDPMSVDAWVEQRVQTFRQGGEWVRLQADGRHIRAIERELEDGRFVTLRTDVSELMQARRNAELASKAKSAFLAGTSHEIRTPLNAILGLGYLLEREPLPPQAREHANRIAVAGRTLLGLVNNVLDLSKIEAGQFELEDRSFALRPVVEGEMPLLAAGAPHNDLHTRVQVALDVPAVVRGDVTRLRQVLTNLLGNALKFTERGSVSLEVRRGAQLPDLVFEVRDTGIGIDAATQARLFRPYEQADAGTARQYGGSGLGLSITARLVELMGGSIELESAPGRGSTFTVTLPLPDAGPAAQDATHDGRLQVVVVGPDAARRERIVGLALSLGWQCRPVEDRAALAVALSGAHPGARPPDVVIVDGLASAVELGIGADEVPPTPAEQAPATLVIGHVDASDGSALLGAQPSGSELYDAVSGLLASMPERSHRLFLTTLAHGDGLQWLHGLRLMVVDDGSLNLDVARKILEYEGAVVTTCSGGEQALRLLDENAAAFDAVLLDVQMPGMDGLAVVRHLRTESRFQALPVIALSAGVLKHERDDALQAGMSDFLPKPMEPRRVVACLRHHIEARRGKPLPVRPRPGGPALAPPLHALGIAGIEEGAIEATLRCDRPLVLSLIRRLVDSLEDIEATPPSALPALVHRLRGSAQVVGASALAEVALTLETALRNPSNADDAGLRLQALKREADILASSARPKLVEEDARLESARAREAQAALGSGVAMRAEEWAELRELLVSQSTRAMQCAERLSISLSYSMGAKRLDGLRAALAEFDFARALAVLDDGMRTALRGESEPGSLPPAQRRNRPN